jgi:hypothetical protein
MTSVSSVFLPFRKRFELRTSNAADSFSAIDNYARKRRRHERLAFLVPSEKQVKKSSFSFRCHKVFCFMVVLRSQAKLLRNETIDEEQR